MGEPSLYMKGKVSLAALTLLVSATAVPVGAQPRADNYIFSGGGTPVSNGIFFPGTAVYDDQTQDYNGVPYSIERGTDVTFVNVDHSAVSNCHKMVSFKKRRGRALFSSKNLCEPGEQSLVVTSHLKPGIYDFYCTIHFGMYGLLEVTG